MTKTRAQDKTCTINHHLGVTDYRCNWCGTSVHAEEINKELLEAAKLAAYGDPKDGGRMSSCSGYGENGCGKCSSCKLKAAIAKAEGK